MIILVEGMDNTGKTTLAENLMAIFGIPTLIHSVGPKDAELLEGHVENVMAIARDKDVVLDRLPLFSDMVYGPILRGKTAFRQEWWEDAMARFMEFDPIIIYSRPPLNAIAQSMGERWQMDGVAENIRELTEGYDLFFLTMASRMRFWTYDYTTDPDAEALMRNLVVGRG